MLTVDTSAWCTAYSDERQKNINLQQPYQEKEDIIGELLFENSIEETKETIYTEILENQGSENETTVTRTELTRQIIREKGSAVTKAKLPTNN